MPVLNNGQGNHIGFKAGLVLYDNSRMSIDAIKMILHSKEVSMQFRKVLARETQRQDVLEILLVDRSETVKRHAQKNVNSTTKHHGTSR